MLYIKTINENIGLADIYEGVQLEVGEQGSEALLALHPDFFFTYPDIMTTYLHL